MPVPGDIVKRLRKERYWTQEKLRAKAHGEELLGTKSTEWFSLFERDGVVPTEELRAAFARVFGMNLAQFDALWMPPPKTPPKRPPPKGIPLVNRVSAGRVVDFDHEQSENGEYHDPASFIDRGTIEQGDAFAATVDGDSMEPTLRHGDVCVFLPVYGDKPASRPKPGDVVFIRYGRGAPEVGCQIARYRGSVDGLWELSKDNPLFDPFKVDPEHVDRVGVFREHRKTWL